MFDMREQVTACAAPEPRPDSPSAGNGASPAAARWRSALVSGATLGGLWVALTGLELTSIAFGVPAVLAGAGLAYVFPPATPWRIAPLPALGFAGFFAWQSLRGALDVARRALDPRLPVRPGFRTVILTLRDGPGRVLLANTISLLPGTLSAEIEGRHLIVHTLDLETYLAVEVVDLEARIRKVFGAQP
jgi:multicomponent Na+:H+ antiporter subunit E